MKVLHLIQKKQLRGAEVFTAQLSQHLSQNGHQALIVPVFGGEATLPFNGPFMPLNARQGGKYWDLKGWKALAAIIEREQPHVVQANAGDTLKYAIFSKLLFGWKQPVVFRNASTISLYIKGGFVKKLYHFLFSRTATIISVSQTSAHDFVQLFPHCKNKVVVIPIGIERNQMVEQKTFQNPFKATRVPALAPRLLHVGGFTFEKNHSGLISIFKRVLAHFPEATLHLVGDGPLRRETEALVRQELLSQQVFFHGFQREPLPWMQHADAVLLPSIIEGLPGVILEAFYCKTPVVAYDTGGIHEIVVPRQTGRLVPKNNEAAFAEAIFDVFENKLLTENMVEAAYELVTQHYLNTKVAKGFLNIYSQLNPAARTNADKATATLY